MKDYAEYTVAWDPIMGPTTIRHFINEPKQLSEKPNQLKFK